MEHLSFREVCWKLQFAYLKPLLHFLVIFETSPTNQFIFKGTFTFGTKIHLVLSHRVVCNFYVVNDLI